LSAELQDGCLRVIARVVALALCGAAIACARSEPEPARIVLVTIDTLRADHVGCYGAARARTPTLDALARDGVRFETAISPAPLTLPSHTTILTGLDPDRHGVRHNGVFALAPDVPTLPERLRARGYATAAFVGAFVLDHRFGLGRGFDVYDDRIGERRSSRGVVGYAERRADAVVDAFLGWLPRAPERFFAWIHVYDPHSQYDPPDAFLLGFAGNPYDGEIAFVDAQLARLLEALDRRFPREGTLVVVTSDHGESLGEHGEPTHSYSIYEATQRVPLIASGPGFRGGELVHGVVRLADVAPTLAASARAEALPESDGRDLRALLGGGGADERAYSETLATHLDYGWSALFAVRDERWRYIQAPEPELYDVAADAAERRNVASEHPDVAAERAAWLAERRARGPSRTAQQTLSADERARLAALGYVAGAAGSQAGDLGGADPKARMFVLAALQRAEDLGKVGRAADAYAVLSPLEESGTGFRVVRASFAIRAGLLDAAERDLEAALAQSPADPDSLRALALVKEQQRDALAARALYERAMAADPSDVRSPIGLGRIAEAQDDLTRAEEQYRAALRVDPGASEAQWRLAALRLRANDRDGAEALLAEAAPPADPMLALRVAALEMDAGRVEAAAARLDGAIADADLPAALVPPAAAILETGGRLPAATRTYEAALRADPKSWALQNGVAWGLASEGRDLDRALALAREAAEASQRDPGVLDTLATVELARGDPTAALATASAALPRAAPAVRSHLNYVRAQALAGVGRRGEARAAIGRSLRDAPAGAPWQRAAESLAKQLEADTSAAPPPP
jgi:arylsulfatase A-like enzyme/Tfp pilus assembly protein PilF